MMGVQAEICSFFGRSAQRQARLTEMIQASSASTSKREKLRSLSRTRWVERYDSLETTQLLLPVLNDTLDSLIEDRNYVKTHAPVASSLQRNICSFDFVICLCVAHMLMDVTKGLCVQLQGMFVFTWPGPAYLYQYSVGTSCDESFPV